MCGIFGYSGKDPIDSLNLLRLQWLACENEARGDDAVGVYGNYLYKKAITASDAINLPEFENAVLGATTVIGHTRNATSGTKLDKDAHPFEVYSEGKKRKLMVIGTHNGQIFDQTIALLSDKYKIDKTDVDSEFIYKFLVHHNFDYDKALSELEGTMALAFIRPKFPDHLYLYRRTSKPLHIGFIDGANMFYSSEIEPLHKIGCTATMELEPDKLYVFKLGGLLGVSPVKKPQINIITKDVGLTSVMKTLTQGELRVLGICGANVERIRVCGDSGNQTQGRVRTMFTEDGGIYQGTMIESPFNTSGEISLLNSTSLELYETNSIRKLELFRVYDNGDFSCCYIFGKLISARDNSITLPAWIVRVRGHAYINCVSAHNGIFALKIPDNLCNKSLTLDVVNPLYPTAVYELVFNQPITGRTMEVVLYIPFPSKKETEKTDKDKDTKQFSSGQPDVQNETKNNQLFSFPEIWNFYVRDQSTNGALRSKIGSGLSKGCDVGECDVDDEVTTYVQSRTGVGIKQKLSTEFSPENDILNMDYYSATVTKSELTHQISKVKELLSSPSLDERIAKDVLVSLLNDLEYLESYLENRLTQYENNIE